MTRIFIIFVVVIGVVFGSIVTVELWLNLQNSISENQESKIPVKYLTAATYYGDAWVINFWSSDFSSTDQNMERIRNDGFNTIVLVVPWGEFQPGISPIKYNDIAFQRLNYIIEKANSHGLNVVLRISYLWDFFPEVQMSGPQRILNMENDSVYQA